MKSIPTTNNSAIQPGLFASWKLLSFLSLLLLAKLFSSLEGYPVTWCDEIVYTEPAVNLVKGGPYAAPGIARQLETKGLKGLDEHYYLNVPLGTYARVAIYELLGADQRGRRVADWIFLAVTTAVLVFALRRWVTHRSAILAGIVFVMHRLVGSDYGRPDLLSLLFGLVALVLTTKAYDPSGAGTSFHGRAFFVGLFIGLSGLCHQFGGVFWAVIVIATHLAIQGNASKPLQIAQWLFCFVIGGLTAALSWLPQIAFAPHAWYRQFFYLLGLKQHLIKSFAQSAHFLVLDTFGKNAAVCFMVVAGSLLVKWRNHPQTKLRLVLMVCLLLLAAWRCHSFEPYIRQYSIHFWAGICILFAFIFDDWSNWLKKQFSETNAWLINNAAIMVVVLAGSLTTYVGTVEAFFLPFHETRKEILALLRKQISPDDRVLVGEQYYYDVPTRRKSVWYWSEKLDLNDFNVVVASFTSPQSFPVSDGRDRDQWNLCFTPEQAAVFNCNFELTTNVPGKRFTTALSPPHYTPRIEGCYIYRNKHPNAVSTNTAVSPQNP